MADTINIEPNREATTLHLAECLVQGKIEKGYEGEVMATVVRDAGYLGQTDPEALMRIARRLDPGLAE